MNKKTIVIISISILILALVVVGVLFFSKVVNANKLSCTSGNESNGVRIEQNYTIDFAKDKVKSVTIIKKFAYTDEKQFDAFKSVVIPGNDSKMNELKNDNITYKSTVNGKTYSTKTIINVDKASKADVTEIGVNKSLKTLKSNLENQGLVCK